MADNQDQFPPVEPPHFEPIGERLRAQRESLGLSFEDVAKQLHLDRNILLALEADDFDRLPSPAYIKGYLRSYAQLLEIDAQALIDDYQNQTRPIEPEFKPPLPPQRNYQTLRGRMYLAGSAIALLLILLAAWWYTQKNSSVNHPRALTTNANPIKKEPVLTKPLTSSSSTQLPSQNASVSEASTITLPATILPPAAPRQAKGIVPPPGEQVAKKTVSNEPGKIGTINNKTTADQSQLILNLSHRSWVQINDANGNRLAYGMMAAGTHQTLTGTPPFSVFLGYAPGAQLSMGGHQVQIAPYIRANHTARFKVPASAAGTGQ